MPQKNSNENSLERFVDAQQGVYNAALEQLKRGKKTGHWIWFIFPQCCELGQSYNACYYGIKDRTEADMYLAHPLLGRRLVECTEAVLSHQGKSIVSIFGTLDALKFRSSMTLFGFVAGDSDSPFSLALQTFCDGISDEKTLQLLQPKYRTGFEASINV